MFGMGMILGGIFLFSGIVSTDTGIVAQVILVAVGAVCFFGCLFGMIKHCGHVETETEKLIIPSAPPEGILPSRPAVGPSNVVMSYDVQPVQYGQL